MKLRILIASICLLSLLAGTAIQYWILGPDISSFSVVDTEEFVNGDTGKRIDYVYEVSQLGRIPTGQDGTINITFRTGTPAVVSIEGVRHQIVAGEQLVVPVHATEDGKNLASMDLIVGDAKTSLPLPFYASASIVRRAWISVAISIPFLVVGLLTCAWVVSRRRAMRDLEEKIEKAEGKVESQPSKARFAWDLARVKLEAYFDRNLLQVNQVFIVAIVVMIVGFSFVLLGVLLSWGQQKITPISVVAGGAGIITEFIGATFMAIYRSTMAQANEFMSVLERINAVGMAVQVLDSIPDSEVELKNRTRAHIVELLLSANIRSNPSPRKSNTKSQAE